MDNLHFLLIIKHSSAVIGCNGGDCVSQTLCVCDNSLKASQAKHCFGEDIDLNDQKSTCYVRENC